MLFPSSFLALQVTADMSDLLMSYVINAISFGHLLVHYPGFSVFLVAYCFIVYACYLLVTASYIYFSFWYGLDEELYTYTYVSQILFLFFSGGRIDWPLDFAAESQFAPHCSPQRMTLQIKVETVLLQSGTDLCTEKKEQKYLATKWCCPGLFSVQKKKLSWAIYSVQGKKAEGKKSEVSLS